MGMIYGKKIGLEKTNMQNPCSEKNMTKNICTHNEFMEILTSVGEK